MRKHLLSVAVGLLAVGLFAGAALAQEGEDGGGRRRGRGGQGGGGADRGQAMQRFEQARGQAMVNQLIRELNLDEERAEKVRAVFREHQQELRERRGEMREQGRELREQMQAAREAGDEEKMAQLREEMNQMRTRSREADNKLLEEKLSKVLTGDEMAQAKLILQPREPHRLGQILRVLRTMPLSDTQRDKIKSIMDNAADRIEGVLTEEQREALQNRIERGSPQGQRQQFMQQQRGQRGGRQGGEGGEGDNQGRPRRGRGRRGDDGQSDEGAED